MEIINLKKNKMKSLTNKYQKSYQNAKISNIYRKKFEDNHAKDKICYEIRKYRGAAHSTCNSKYRVPKEIPTVFHNGSNYDYNFIRKELVEEFEK